MGLYTEQGVVARRERAARTLITRDPRAARRRAGTPLARRPAHRRRRRGPTAIFGGVPLGLADRLLRNRPLDVWMHEQDVRRAVGLPGRPGLRGRRSTRADYLAESLPHRASPSGPAPRPGTTVVLRGGRQPPRSLSWSATTAAAGPLPERPATRPSRLGMDRETFIVLAGGDDARRRRAPWPSRATPSSAQRVLARHGDHPVSGHLEPTDIAATRPGGRALVTGCTLGGLGYYTALELARRGAARRAGRPHAEQARRRPSERSAAEVPDAGLDRLVRRPRRPRRRYDARGRGRRRSARSTCWSTTPA